MTTMLTHGSTQRTREIKEGQSTNIRSPGESNDALLHVMVTGDEAWVRVIMVIGLRNEGSLAPSSGRAGERA